MSFSIVFKNLSQVLLFQISEFLHDHIFFSQCLVCLSTDSAAGCLMAHSSGLCVTGISWHLTNMNFRPAVPLQPWCMSQKYLSQIGLKNITAWLGWGFYPVNHLKYGLDSNELDSFPVFYPTTNNLTPPEKLMDFYYSQGNANDRFISFLLPPEHLWSQAFQVDLWKMFSLVFPFESYYVTDAFWDSIKLNLKVWFQTIADYLCNLVASSASLPNKLRGKKKIGPTFWFYFLIKKKGRGVDNWHSWNLSVTWIQDSVSVASFFSFFEFWAI